MISVAIGGRYVMARNSYEGSMTNITINAPAVYGGTMAPGDYGRVLASLVDNEMVQELLLSTASELDAATVDQYLEASQAGSGFTPIIGVNVNLFDMLNIGAKYEHHTKIELTNETTTDDVGMFPDGETVRADLPGMFAVGAAISPIDKLEASLGFNYFLDKGANFGYTDPEGNPVDNSYVIDENSWTLQASLQYRMIGPLGISAGYTFGNLGVNDNYQSGLTYANKNSSIAGGLFFEVGELLVINAGYVHTMYDDYSVDFSGDMGSYTETYGKATDLFAIGVDIMF
jgi:long-subunit fatty acid transport protein